MILNELQKQKLITPPKWLVDNAHYVTIMGSMAYGVSSDNSDMDLYGFCIPPKNDVFPHLRGEIVGFGKQIQRFEQYQQHHIEKKDSKQIYDITIYSIVKYFQLCMENNPNMIDSLFTPRRCVIHSTQLGNHVKDNRKLFLHKGAWFKFKGYSYQQMAKIRNKSNSSNEKRSQYIEKYGFDLKFAYHLVRLLNEVEQILIEHDLDLEKNREQLKSIRRGEWSLEQIEKYFQEKEKTLEYLYTSSTLQHCPNEEKIKNLLLECLEIHYGSLSDAIKLDANIENVLYDLQTVIDRYRK